MKLVEISTSSSVWILMKSFDTYRSFPKNHYWFQVTESALPSIKVTFNAGAIHITIRSNIDQSHTEYQYSFQSKLQIFILYLTILSARIILKGSDGTIRIDRHSERNQNFWKSFETRNLFVAASFFMFLRQFIYKLFENNLQMIYLT